MKNIFTIKKERESIRNFRNFNKRDIIEWNEQEVSEWISQILMLPNYSSIILKNKINGKKLVYLCEIKDSLKEIGINKIGPRKIIIKETKKLTSKKIDYEKDKQFLKLQKSYQSKNKKKIKNHYMHSF